MVEFFAKLLDICMSNIMYFVLQVQNGNSFPKPLSAKSEHEQLVKMKNGDPNAKNTLIEHNLRLVAHIIKKYYSNVEDQEDLISIGTIGLIKAISTFDADKGTRLATYAARCIENEILMYFRSLKKNCLDISMNEPIETDKDDNSLTLMDIIADGDYVCDEVDLKIKVDLLRKFIKKYLSTREQTIIVLRYGLQGSKPLTQREVATILNISRSYVSRIEKKALIILKKHFEKENSLTFS